MIIISLTFLLISLYMLAAYLHNAIVEKSETQALVNEMFAPFVWTFSETDIAPYYPDITLSDCVPTYSLYNDADKIARKELDSRHSEGLLSTSSYVLALSLDLRSINLAHNLDTLTETQYIAYQATLSKFGVTSHAF